MPVRDKKEPPSAGGLFLQRGIVIGDRLIRAGAALGIHLHQPAPVIVLLLLGHPEPLDGLEWRLALP
jgi:hypothetical protein